jgi:hypothetical protein
MLRDTEPLLGLVATRGRCVANASRTTLARRSRTDSRLRAWLRELECRTSSPSLVKRLLKRASSRLRCLSESTSLCCTFQRKVIRVLVLLMCWPPGPLARLAVSKSSLSGMTRPRRTRRSSMPTLCSYQSLPLRACSHRLAREVFSGCPDTPTYRAGPRLPRLFRCSVEVPAQRGAVAAKFCLDATRPQFLHDVAGCPLHTRHQLGK